MASVVVRSRLLMRKQAKALVQVVNKRNLNVHENVSMRLLRDNGVQVPNFGVAKSPNEVTNIIKELKSKDYVVKAQVLAGGRCKGHFDNGLKGGVRMAFSKSVASKVNMISVRKLYTDHIYPYPYEYINTKINPGAHRYRETWPHSPWYASDDRIAWYLWRFFWAFWWYQLFCDPGVILGHHTFPDPNMWTDEELGIPPDDFGSYYDWLEKINELS